MWKISCVYADLKAGSMVLGTIQKYHSASYKLEYSYHML